MEAYLSNTALLFFAIASFALWSKAAADNTVEIESEHEPMAYGEWFCEKWCHNFICVRFVCSHGDKWLEYYGGLNSLGLPKESWWQREACQDFCRKLNEREEV